MCTFNIKKLPNQNSIPLPHITILHL